jgi:hypothetical protein
MSRERRLIFLWTTAERRLTWPRVWFIIVAAAAGAILLWLGLVLAFIVVLMGTLALLPVWAWRSFTTHLHAEGPATIEGEYSLAAKSSADAGDEALERTPTGHAERQHRRFRFPT